MKTQLLLLVLLFMFIDLQDAAAQKTNYILEGLLEKHLDIESFEINDVSFEVHVSTQLLYDRGNDQHRFRDIFSLKIRSAYQTRVINDIYIGVSPYEGSSVIYDVKRQGTCLTLYFTFQKDNYETDFFIDDKDFVLKSVKKK